MALEIEFVDGPLEVEVGNQARVRVLQADAAGSKHPIRIDGVAFSYTPIDWGRVRPTDDPAVGLLEVVEVVESDDLLLTPVYNMKAALRAETGQTLKPADRLVRLLPGPVEVELGFELLWGKKQRRFAPQDLRQPIDWTKVVVSDPQTQSVVVHEGRPYLRLESIAALPVEVGITLPNGEMATLELRGRLEAVMPEPAPAAGLRPDLGPDGSGASPRPTVGTGAASAPSTAASPTAASPPASAAPPAEAAPAAAAPAGDAAPTIVEPGPAAEAAAAEAAAPRTARPRIEPAPAGAEAASAAHEEVGKLRRYVTSFLGPLRANPDEEAAERIRERIRDELTRVWDLVQAAPPGEREDLQARFVAATEPVPDARRCAQDLLEEAGAAAG